MCAPLLAWVVWVLLRHNTGLCLTRRDALKTRQPHSRGKVHTKLSHPVSFSPFRVCISLSSLLLLFLASLTHPSLTPHFPLAVCPHASSTSRPTLHPSIHRSIPLSLPLPFPPPTSLRPHTLPCPRCTLPRTGNQTLGAEQQTGCANTLLLS